MTAAGQLRDALRELHEQIAAMGAEGRTSYSSAEFVSWQARATSTLTRAVGAHSHITGGFTTIRWWPGVNTRATSQQVFLSCAQRAQGFLEAAIADLELPALDDLADSTDLDPELWAHISAHVHDEDWGAVASQTAIFTEDRIRRWTKQQPAELVGKDLMVAALGETGNYRLGLTAGEKQGWQFLAMGISQALRNADAHRIQTRPDHHRYAMGVAGASSLLLTQLRYEHGRRFHDTSPIANGDGDSGRAAPEESQS